MIANAGIEDRPMATTTDPTWRRVVALVFGTLAVIGLLASVIGVWAHRVAFDPPRVSAAVEIALLDPEVTDGLAVYLAEQVFVAVPVAELLAGQVPEFLAPAVPLLVSEAEDLVRSGIERVLQDPTTRRLLVAASEQAHHSVLRVLEGGRVVDGLAVREGVVSANLLPLIGRGLVELQASGLLRWLDVPDLAMDGDPRQQQRELGAVLGRDLPAEFGQLVIYRRDDLARADPLVARAQQAMVIFRRSLAALVVLAGVSLAICVAAATHRRQAVRALLLGVVVAMVAGRLLVRATVDALPGVVDGPGARAAIDSIASSLTSSLFSTMTVLAVLGLVGAAMALLAELAGRRSAGRSVATQF